MPREPGHKPLSLACASGVPSWCDLCELETCTCPCHGR